MKQRLHNVISLAVIIFTAMAAYPTGIVLSDDWRYRETPEVVAVFSCRAASDKAILQDLSLLSEKGSDDGDGSQSLHEQWKALIDDIYEGRGYPSAPPMTTSKRLHFTNSDLDGDGFDDIIRLSSWTVDGNLCDLDLSKILMLEYRGEVHPIDYRGYGSTGEKKWGQIGYRPMDEDARGNLFEKAFQFATIAFALSILSYILFGGVRLRLWRRD